MTTAASQPQRPVDHFTLLHDHAPLTAHLFDAAIARAEAPGGDTAS